MPVPTANLTSHFNASDADHLWTNADHTGVPGHNAAVTLWDDDEARNLTFLRGYTSAGLLPFFNLTSPAMTLPSLKFDSASSFPSEMTLYTPSFSSTIPLTTLITASAFLVGVSFRVFACATNDAATPTNNEGLLTDDSGAWGIYIRNAAGVVSLVFDNNDAGLTPSFTVGSLALNTNYVALFWRTGGSIFGEVYNAGGLAGSGTAANGNAGLGGLVYLGRSANVAFHSSVYIGEIATYNAYVGGDKTNLTSYLRTKWFGGPALPTLTSMTPNSAFANASAPVNLTGVGFTGSGLDGTGGAFNAIAGFTFSSLSIAPGGASGTVNIQVATAKAPGAYTFLYTTTGGSSSGTTVTGVTFTVLAPPVTLASMTPASAYANASVPVKLLGVVFTGTSLDGPSGAFDGGGGFVFTNLVIAAGGASGTVDLQIAAAKAPGNYNFVFTTSAGTSLPLVFTVSALAAGGGDAGGVTQLNAGFN